MEDFSEVTDLETARRILIGYDQAFREGAEVANRWRAGLEKIARYFSPCGEHENDFTLHELLAELELFKSIARDALGEGTIHVQHKAYDPMKSGQSI